MRELDPEKSRLLQIWRENAPPSPQITIQSISNHLAHRCVCLVACVALDSRIVCVVTKRKSELLENSLWELVVVDALFSSLRHSSLEGRAEKTHLDEIVEVSRLKRRVLAIVREAQELARRRVVRRGAHVANR